MSDRRNRTISLCGGDDVFGDDRGVSNVVGYVLVFSLVTLTIGTVFAVGLSGVEDRREAERVSNVERAFDVLDNNLRDIQRYEDPSRATEIRLSGGTLAVSNTTEVELLNGSSVISWHPYSLTYTNGDTAIAYEAGAWFRSDGDGAVMRSEPRFIAANGRTTLPLVILVPDGDRRISGDGTVQVAARESLSNTGPNRSEPGKTLEVRVVSDYAGAWERYFDRTDGFDVNETATTGDTVVAEITEDETVYVRRIRLNVAIRR